MKTPRRIGFALAVALVAAPLTSVADKAKRANAHIAKAVKAHEDGKHEVALAELRAAYEIDPTHDLLFALGQVYVQLGRCDEAAAHYEKFLAATKAPHAKSVVAQALAACKPRASEPAPEPVPEKKPEPAVEPPPEPPRAPAPAPQARAPVPRPQPKLSPPADERWRNPEETPWYKDRLGGALVTGGVIAAVASGAIYLGARADLDDAERADTLAQHDDARDRAEQKRLLSVVLIGGGAALVTAGVVRYVLRERRRSSSVGMAPAPSGGVITWMGRF